MARLVLCILALFLASGSSDPVKKVLPQKIADQTFLKRQVDISYLYFHIHEPAFVPEQKSACTWKLEQNIEKFHNVTAVKIYLDLIVNNWVLPRGLPFTILNPTHQFEAVTLFNVLFSAEDYDIFMLSASFFRCFANEDLLSYVFTTAVLHRPDTQGIALPPIYETFPSYFHNGEIMTTAQRINTHGKHLVDHYPNTYIKGDDVVIRVNETIWPYFNKDIVLSYFTHDHEMNTFYYNWHLAYPFWLGAETCPLIKDMRGEWFWYMHKQILTRYYMERLSNGLGEIPELGLDVVPEGYTSGLVYHKGIPFPARPSHYHLDQPHLVEEIIKITDYERRIRNAIENGYIIDTAGKHIDIHTQKGFDILARVIEANIDSPNTQYYKDFITLWKSVLGNTFWRDYAYYYNGHVPLVLPSVMEHYQSALRDPAFYMIWKRVMKLFTLWQTKITPYKPEELALPSVKIEKVEVDKLVTYFEYSYVNITNHLHLSEHERKGLFNDFSVLAERPQLNHKAFQVRVNVKSEAAKKVLVRFFLAPKYDSYGYEMPLHLNTENFFQLDQFTYDLPEGDYVIKRDSTENSYTVKNWLSDYDVRTKAEDALHGKAQFVIDQSHKFIGFPQRYMLPKGRVGGMPFVFLVYISEYHAPKVPMGTGFDPAMSLGLGSGALRLTSDPLGYPLNRPLHLWQVKDLKNLVIQDVTIFHKPAPEIFVPHTE